VPKRKAKCDTVSEQKPGYPLGFSFSVPFFSSPEEKKGTKRKP
jgi:hypothetical protein